MNKEIQIIKNKERLGCILFETGLVLELLIMMTDAASWTLPYRGRITQVAFGLFVLKILMTKYNIRQIILGGIAGIIGVASYLTCREEYVIRAVIFVIAAIGIDIKLTLKIIFYGMLACTLLIISMALTGIRGEIKAIRDYGRGVIEARYCLGFNHANNVHSVFWYLTALLIMWFKDKIRITHYVIMGLLSIVLYIFTLSRTGLMASLIIIILAVFVKATGKIRKDKDADTNGNSDRSTAKSKAGIADILMLIASVAALIVSMIITIRSAIKFPYHSDIMIKLDHLLTGRVEMVWEHAPLAMWKAFPVGQVAEYVDNGFASTAYSYGYIVLALLVASIVYTAVALFKQRNAYGQIILLSAIMLVFMESTFVFNVSLLCNMLLIVYMYMENERS